MTTQAPPQMAIINTSNGQRAAVAIQQIRAVAPAVVQQQPLPTQPVVQVVTSTTGNSSAVLSRPSSAPAPGSIVVVSSGIQGSGNVIRLQPQQQPAAPTIIVSQQQQGQGGVLLPVKKWPSTPTSPVSPSPPPTATRLIPVSAPPPGTRIALRPTAPQQQQIIVRPGTTVRKPMPVLPLEPLPPASASSSTPPSASPRSTPSPQLVQLPTQPLPPSSTSSGAIFQKPLPVSSPGPARLLANASPVKVVTMTKPTESVNTPLPKAIQLPNEPVPMNAPEMQQQINSDGAEVAKQATATPAAQPQRQIVVQVCNAHIHMAYL